MIVWLGGKGRDQLLNCSITFVYGNFLLCVFCSVLLGDTI